MGQFWNKRLTKADKEKADKDWTMTYEVNGHIYVYENIYLDDSGLPYGYCKKNRRWAWLYPDAVSIYGVDVELIPAIKIDEQIREKKG